MKEGRNPMKEGRSHVISPELLQLPGILLQSVEEEEGVLGRLVDILSISSSDVGVDGRGVTHDH